MFCRIDFRRRFQNGVSSISDVRKRPAILQLGRDGMAGDGLFQGTRRRCCPTLERLTMDIFIDRDACRCGARGVTNVGLLLIRISVCRHADKSAPMRFYFCA